MDLLEKDPPLRLTPVGSDASVFLVPILCRRRVGISTGARRITRRRSPTFDRGAAASHTTEPEHHQPIHFCRRSTIHPSISQQHPNSVPWLGKSPTVPTTVLMAAMDPTLKQIRRQCAVEAAEEIGGRGEGDRRRSKMEVAEDGGGG